MEPLAIRYFYMQHFSTFLTKVNRNFIEQNQWIL